jgi:hypothetical protein
VSLEPPPAGPPPLRPFGLMLHHDGRFSHEGAPILNRRLREHFDRSVSYLPDEKKFIVSLQHFRGEVEVEEAGFFVRQVDLERGKIALSDGTWETLDLTTLESSTIDGVLLCRVKTGLLAGGLLARFSHSAQAELLQAVEPEEDGEDGFVTLIGGVRVPFPEIE